MSGLDLILPYLRPIAHLLETESITEVMVNAGGRRIWMEQGGEVTEVEGVELTEQLLEIAVKHIARSCGQEVSAARPILEARLADGSRVAAMVPPCSVDGITLTIRRFGRRLSIWDLVDLGTVSTAALNRIVDLMERRQNILISGATGSGKSTLLSALATFIPDGHRVALIEETSELSIEKPNLIRFEARAAEAFPDTDHPRPAVSLRDLLRATLRHRPDRIILGEVRGAEAFDLLHAWNTGHPGSLSTIHANSAPLALVKLANLALQASPNLSPRGVERDVAQAVQAVVHLERAGRQRIVTDIHHVPSIVSSSHRVGSG